MLTNYAVHIVYCRWLPLHWALSRDAPSLEVVYQLVGAYPEALFDADYEERLPFDKYALIIVQY